jgi:excisionase family DNA binding protein
MQHRLQSGMRENPASDRRHGSRQVVRSLSGGNCVEEENVPSLPATPSQNHSFAGSDTNLNAASPHAATGEEKNAENEGHAVAVTLMRSQKHPLGFEPLIGSPEAAKLLGNIHVKTLQRYVRHRRIPGYQIGGHWYFRASELDAWLQSRINSNCQPADRVDFTQEKP